MQLAAKCLRDEAKARVRGGIQKNSGDKYFARVRYLEGGSERVIAQRPPR